MDSHTYVQRTAEKERLAEERQQARDLVAQQERAETEAAIQQERKIGQQRGWKGGWGDARTWAWVFTFWLILTGPWLAARLLAGSGWMHTFHLGFPPTHPG